MTDILPIVKAVLATTATRWLSMTETLPADLLNRPPAEGEWSATECLVHLLDVERYVFPTRVQALLAGQAISAFDPDTQGTKNSASSPAELAREFASLRQTSLALLERVTPNDFSRSAEHSELGTITLGQLLHEWAAHDLNHTIQAEQAIMQPFIQGCGPWRVYFRDHEA
ncbi:MAG TPA: DinB family protein [Ktedonobacteraceae bacterium]|nr:DinB family protein [Ktedonobacteraceae bacterium]